MLLLFWWAPHPTDIRIYFGWVTQAALGRTAWLDFPVEYPPLAWWVMQLPGTLDRLDYYARFRLLMAAADIVSFLLLTWLASKRRPSLLTPFACLYVGTTVLLAHELYDRLDMGVLFFTTLALTAWALARPGMRPPEPVPVGRGLDAPGPTLRSAPNARGAAGPRANWWLAAAYVAAGLGASYKIFPAVVGLVFLASDALTRTAVRTILWRVLLLAAAAFAPVAVAYGQAGPAALGFLSYHAARGFEIGSTWASVLWLLSLGGWPVDVVIRFGSWELTGRAEPAVSGAAWLFSLLVPLLIAAWAFALRGRFDWDRALTHAVLALAGVAVVSRVFSPQFLLWAMPAMALAAVDACATRARFLAVGAGLLACAALTVTIYEGGGSAAFTALSPWVMNALAARNAMYVGLWLYLACAVAGRDLARVRGTH